MIDLCFRGSWLKRCFSTRLFGSVEELCAVDLFHSGALSHHDRMEMVLSSCKQIHKADMLGFILHSQVPQKKPRMSWSPFILCSLLLELNCIELN